MKDKKHSSSSLKNSTSVEPDLVICCIQHKGGGAYKTVQYEEEQGVRIYYL